MNLIKKNIGVFSSVFLLILIFQNCVSSNNFEIASVGNSVSSSNSSSNSKDSSSSSGNSASSAIGSDNFKELSNYDLGYAGSSTQVLKKPTLVAANFNRAEYNTPPTQSPVWDFQASYPSRSSCQNKGDIYEVGPSRAYTELDQVPWLSLKPCDIVLIYYRDTSYHNIIVLTSRGEPNQWITIRGIPGPNGEKPVLDAQNAIMPYGTGANEYSDAVALIEIMAPSKRDFADTLKMHPYYQPGYLHISGLRLIGANYLNQVKRAFGSGGVQNIRTEAWTVKGSSASPRSGISANFVDHLVVSNCDFIENGWGVFIKSDSNTQQSHDILLSYNYFYHSGFDQHPGEHNAYIDAIGVVYEKNYFNEPVWGFGSLNVKDRSPGSVFRYNFFRNGQHLIGFQDHDLDNGDIAWTHSAADNFGKTLYSQAYIYQNIFLKDISPDQAGVNPESPSPILSYGGGGLDWNNPACNCVNSRYGSIYFFNNKVIGKIDKSMTYVLGPSGGVYTDLSLPIFQLANSRLPTSVDARNNIFYMSSYSSNKSAALFSLFSLQGIAHFLSNWSSAFILTQQLASDGSFNVGTPFDGSGLGGLSISTGDPGFVDINSNNFLAKADSISTKLTESAPVEMKERKLIPQNNINPPVALKCLSNSDLRTCSVQL